MEGKKTSSTGQLEQNVFISGTWLDQLCDWSLKDDLYLVIVRSFEPHEVNVKGGASQLWVQETHFPIHWTFPDSADRSYIL